MHSQSKYNQISAAASPGSLLKVETDEAAGFLPVFVAVTQQKVPPDEGVCIPTVKDQQPGSPL